LGDLAHDPRTHALHRDRSVNHYPVDHESGGREAGAEVEGDVEAAEVEEPSGARIGVPADVSDKADRSSARGMDVREAGGLQRRGVRPDRKDRHVPLNTGDLDQFARGIGGREQKRSPS
jgi:hypothetical protein